MPRCRKFLLLLLLVIPAGCVTEPPQPPPDVNLAPPTKTAVEQPAKPEPLPPPPISPTLAPTTNHTDFVDTWVPLEKWSEANGFGVPKKIGTATGWSYSLLLTNGTLNLEIGSQLAYWRGVELHLGFAPELINGHPFIHTLDIHKNLLPLLDEPPRAKFNHPLVIVIDPGHGGTDSGTSNIYNGHFEKEFTLDWARRLRALLVTNGWTVYLTRTNDVLVPLANRVAFAQQEHADLFVSLHFNSAYPAHQEAGLETYCLTPQGMPSTLTRGFRDNSSLTFPNNTFDEENLRLAADVQRSILKVNGHLDRGVRRARFLGVLQGENRPAILIEGGYLSNPREAKRIADPAYRAQLAEAVAEALTAHFAAQPQYIAKALAPAPATNEVAHAEAPPSPAEDHHE